MNLALDFLSSKLPIHGVAAYCIRSAAAPLASDCFSKSLYPNSTQDMLNRVVEEGRTLFPYEGSPANYCWTFESHQVYVAARADGIALALLVENNAGIQLSRIRELLQGFLEMEQL
ncbi:MAG TPA: hypothetical protein VLT36_21995 [Candidatus Dormibacteraeota bacterium]|nr:hypothetical protein [Candidatus Dormibacteraeota bacterium]